MFGKSILVLVPNAHQLIYILAMYLIDVIVVWVFVLNNPNWSAHNNVDGTAVRHHADIVVEDTAGMEDGDSEAHEFLDEHLQPVDVRVLIGVKLVIDVVFAKCEDGN
jgi:hypothetical protein